MFLGIGYLYMFVIFYVFSFQKPESNIFLKKPKFHNIIFCFCLKLGP